MPAFNPDNNEQLTSSPFTWRQYGLRRKYKHMSAPDRTVWESFIVNHPNYFRYVAYDVPVGRGAVVHDDPAINFQKMATALTQLRIDVLAASDHHLHICEIKPHFQPQAVGQLLIYRTLFQKTYNPVRPIELDAIFFTASEDAYLAAREHLITTHLAGTIAGI